jgi:hypothetical protein
VRANSAATLRRSSTHDTHINTYTTHTHNTTPTALPIPVVHFRTVLSHRSYSLLLSEGIPSRGTKPELLQRLEEHEEKKRKRLNKDKEEEKGDDDEDEGDEGEDEQEEEEDEDEEEDEEDKTASDPPAQHHCNADNARNGHCQRLVKAPGEHCHSHQNASQRPGRKRPPAGKHTPRTGRKRSSKRDSTLDPKRARGSSPGSHGRHSPSDSPAGSTTLGDLENLKKIMEFSQSMNATLQPASALKPMSFHDLHEMHMDVIHGLVGVPGNSTARSRAMGVHGVPDEEATAVQTVKSVLVALHLQQHEAAFHRLGVREVADLVNLHESELDKISLNTVEKRRFHRTIAAM